MAPAPLAALLGKGARYSGDLTFEGRVRVDGHFKGQIHTEDVLEVGESGVVEGHVDAATLVVSGRVAGSIRATQRLIVTRTGNVSGDVDAAQLEVEVGACFDAKVRVG
jgi:cytoskeletal protein CcmA (bactofilin family)